MSSSSHGHEEDLGEGVVPVEMLEDLQRALCDWKEKSGWKEDRQPTVEDVQNSIAPSAVGNLKDYELHLQTFGLAMPVMMQAKQIKEIIQQAKKKKKSKKQRGKEKGNK